MKTTGTEEAKNSKTTPKSSEFWSLEHLYTNVKPKQQATEEEPVLVSRMSFGTFRPKIEETPSKRRRSPDAPVKKTTKKPKLQRNE